MDFKKTKHLISLLEDASTGSSAIHEIVKPVFHKVGEELFGDEGTAWKCLSIVLDLLQSIQFMFRHQKGCFTALDDAGLTEFLSAMLKMITTSLTNKSCERDLPMFIESCTETIVVVADTEQPAKTKIISSLIGQLFEVIQHPSLVFKTKLEVLRSVNMLLEQCPVHVKESVLESADTQQRITSLAEMVSSVGDYEFQVCIIECLMRIFPRKARQKFAEIFIEDTMMMEEFLMIRDKVFETDCRLFLNNVNARNEDPTNGVYSFPCVSACIGQKQLRKPDDPNYEEFWVDFNIGSSRITIFCEQEGRLSQDSQIDEALWETIEIARTNIKKYAICIENDQVLLEFSLKKSLNQLYPSQQYSQQSGCAVNLQFVMELEDHVAHAVRETFNLEKRKAKASTVEFPLHISVKDQECHFATRQVNEQTSNSQEQSSQSGSMKKRKVSVPFAPMKLSSNQTETNSTTPKADKCEAKGSTKGKTPETPSKKPTSAPKVKTPVVKVCSPVKKRDAQKSSKPSQKKETARKTRKNASKKEEDTVIPETQQEVDPDIQDNPTNITKQTDQPIETSVTVNRKKSSVPSISMSELLSVKSGGSSETEEKSPRPCGSPMQTEVIEETQPSQHSSDRAAHETMEGSEVQEGPESVPPVVNSPGVENFDKDEIPDYVPEVDSQNNKQIQDKEDKQDTDDNTSPKETLSIDESRQKGKTGRSSRRKVKKTEEDVQNFGFDEIDDVDRVPESLEPVIDNTETETKSRSKVSDQKDVEDKENIDPGDKKDTDEAEKENKPKSKHSKKKKGKEKTKSFTDVNKSLKELCDLDNKENSKTKKLSRGIEKQVIQDRKPLSQEEVDNIYTFSEPDVQTNNNNLKASKSNKKGKSASSASDKDDSKTQRKESKEQKTDLNSKAGKNNNKNKLEKNEKITDYFNDKSSKNNSKNKTEKNQRKVDDQKDTNEAADEVNHKKDMDKLVEKDTSTTGARTLRRRKVNMNYTEPSDTDGDSIYQSAVSPSVCEDDASNMSDGQSQQVDDSHQRPSEKDVTSHPETILPSAESSPDRLDTGVSNEQNKDEFKIVTVNSEESDIESLHDNDDRDSPDLQAKTSFRSDKCEESITSSLYVESDDSCNARSYKLNCKEKKRRSSLKNNKQKQVFTEDETKTDYVDKHQEHNETGTKVKSRRKSVSFDDSVLKDLSPIHKESENEQTKNHGQNEKEQTTAHGPGKDRLERKSKEKTDLVDKKKLDKNKTKKKDETIESRPKRGNSKETFQTTYSKFESRDRPWSKLQELSKTRCGGGYDPFDFDAQADNASNRSERLDRLDISKRLNEKHSSKAKEKKKGTKQKKSKSKKKDTEDITDNCTMFDEVEDCQDTTAALMVQDEVTKRWHRSADLDKQNKGKQGNKTKHQSKDTPMAAADSSSSSSLSPLQIDSGKPPQYTEKSEDMECESSDMEETNSFKNILKDIECNRQKKNERKDEGFFPAMDDDPCLETHDHISPIQTPYLSCASTPKMCSGKRKQYTPLNISVIKTPQSAVSEKEDNMSWKHQDDETVLLSSMNKSANTSHPSEKSWILSKKKPKKTPKNQATYKAKKKGKAKVYYKSESESESDVSDEEVTNIDADKTRQYSDMLRNLIKPCMIRLDDLGLAKERNNKHDESVSSDTADQSMDVPAISHKQKSTHLEDIILTPYTPIKHETSTQNPDDCIEVDQTHEDLAVELSDEDGESFYNSKLQKHALLGDSGFHSGPSSAVKRPQVSSLKRKYPDLDLLEDGDDTLSQSSIEETQQVPVVPKKLFKFDCAVEDRDDTLSQSSIEELQQVPVVPKKLFKFDCAAKEQNVPVHDGMSCSDITEEMSNYGFNSGLPNFLNSFSSDVQRQMERKKEQVEAFTKQAVKELQKHHSQNWVVQQQYRSNVDVEYKTKMMIELEALERDIDLLREAGQKTTDLYKFQLDVLHRNHNRQSTSLNNMRNLQTYLKEKSRKVGHHNKNLQNDLKEVLRKDVNSLQRRLIEQTQKDEFQNVKRNLQRTFSSGMIW